MVRRKFIRDTFYTLSLGFTSFAYLQSCTAPDKKKSPELENQNHPELEEITIEELQELMTAGKMTARQITEGYLRRIEMFDKNGPKLNSVIELNPDALAIADALDSERKNNKVRGPLHGIPVLIKDNINTADKMSTTAGSLALEANHASKDAFIISQLREAGVVLLGKTNLSEWANFRSTRSSSGWSSRGGQTKNPYVLERSPCGSSSGSGTAAAANLCAIAIGTETDGSIACPSALSALVGIKPTIGLWSRSGIIPISESQDTAGPMARTVRDAAILLGALTTVDPEDKYMQGRRNDVPQDYTTFLQTDGLKGKTIGLDKAYIKGHEAIDVLLQKAIDQMKSAGANVVEVEFSSKFSELSADEYERMLFEFKDGLNKYLASSGTKFKNLEELISFNKQNETAVMPYFKQEIFEAAQSKSGIDSPAYKALNKKVTESSRKIFADVFKAHKLDAVCGPANGPGWCIDLVNGDHFTGYGMYSPAAVAGYPSITVPLGLVSGLPIGLSFLGEAFMEGKLLTIAYAYEQLSKNRSKPTYIANHIGY